MCREVKEKRAPLHDGLRRCKNSGTRETEKTEKILITADNNSNNRNNFRKNRKTTKMEKELSCINFSTDKVNCTQNDVDIAKKRKTLEKN